MTLINTFYIDTYKLRDLRDINKGPFTALYLFMDTKYKYLVDTPKGEHF